MFSVRFNAPLSGLLLDCLLWSLTVVNIDYLLRFPNTPTLYESGIRYARESRGLEDWNAIPEILKRGKGDCEDLACYRVADLRVRHQIEAYPKWQKVQTISGEDLYHILVQLPNGHLEDPSRVLGM